MMHEQERERLMDVFATIDVATDPEMMAQIRKSESQLAQGEGMSIADLEARLARGTAPSAEGEPEAVPVKEGVDKRIHQC